MSETNYDESKVPVFNLPSPLDKVGGGKIKTAFDWVNFRRPEILKMYRDEVYGKLPPRPNRMSFELLSCREDALDNTAIRKEIRIHVGMNNGREHHFDMLLYIPKNAIGPVPAFLGLNFIGNHGTTEETDVAKTGLLRSEQLPHGEQKRRWEFKKVIQRGYASATICYFDIFPDVTDGWKNSIYALFEDNCDFDGSHESYTAISAWAWGLSRGMDCLECESLIDRSKVAVHGHSRLGKSSLWAGANDTRFRFVISNDSGCMGAALSKRCFGEVIERITKVFPHWFVKSLTQYSNNEEALNFDQHFLISLIAPRPVCIASATEDLWADPKGEFLSGVYAFEVYQLFGATGLGTDIMPPPDTPITGEISYHLRTGKHDQLIQDWRHYLDIADIYFKPS